MHRAAPPIKAFSNRASAVSRNDRVKCIKRDTLIKTYRQRRREGAEHGPLWG